ASGGRNRGSNRFRRPAWARSPRSLEYCDARARLRRHRLEVAAQLQKGLCSVGGAQDGAHAGGRDIGIEPAAKEALSVGRAALDIGGCLHVAALADCVLGVIDDVHHRAARLRERGNDTRHEAVTAAADAAFGAVDGKLAGEDAVGAAMRFGPVDELETFAFARKIVALECVPDIFGAEFAARRVGDGLDNMAEARLHTLGQLQPLVLLENPGDAALARLAVDANDRFITAPEVGGVDREIGNLPPLVVLAFARGKALLDGVLMAARKCR